MKTRHAIILLVSGYCLDFLAALLMILHWSGGNEILVIATIMKVSGGLLLLYKIFTYPKLKDFLDW